MIFNCWSAHNQHSRKAHRPQPVLISTHTPNPSFNTISISIQYCKDRGQRPKTQHIQIIYARRPSLPLLLLHQLFSFPLPPHFGRYATTKRENEMKVLKYTCSVNICPPPEATPHLVNAQITKILRYKEHGMSSPPHDACMHHDNKNKTQRHVPS